MMELVMFYQSYPYCIIEIKSRLSNIWIILLLVDGAVKMEALTI